MANHGLKTVEFFKDKKFIIPSYQRGYRWTNVEVRQLLDDLNDFFDLDRKDKDYYCLQPIVSKKNGAEYTIIDGQQRITTIFLLIKFLFNISYFTISYETRKSSEEFLENIEKKNDENSKSNIDFFYIYNAFKCIKEWFTGKELFDKEALLNNVKVIWYEIPDDECEIDVFERMNIGKIQLTEAEKIKALFLSTKVCGNKDNVKDKAKIWYEAEMDARKNNDKLYCLFQNIKQEDIQMSEVSNDSTGKVLGELNDDVQRVFVYLNSIAENNNENESLFEYYYKRFKSKELETDWKNFESCHTIYLNLIENNNDYYFRFLYHLIGFIINQSINKYTARNIWLTFNSKKNNIQSMYNHFKDMIVARIKKYIDELASLSFLDKNEKNKIYEALLLYDILLYQEDISSAQVFPFNRFKLDKYSLEHIHAQKSSIVKDKRHSKELYNWLYDIYKFYEEEYKCRSSDLENDNQEILERLESVIDRDSKVITVSEQELYDLIEYLDQYFNLMENMHFIENITLLDQANNSRLSNLPYSSKQKIIKKQYYDPNFIPKSTKEVFNKDTEYWTSNYRKEYLENIKCTLINFLGEI